MNLRNLNRWQAGSGHLSFSVLLGAAVFVLFRFVWYPDALFELGGAAKLMLLVVGIDVALGPLLTLIVFDPKKKSLIGDTHIHGPEGVSFYTRGKVVTTRWGVPAELGTAPSSLDLHFPTNR